MEVLMYFLTVTTPITGIRFTLLEFSVNDEQDYFLISRSPNLRDISSYVAVVSFFLYFIITANSSSAKLFIQILIF